jgi:hypothetical protein
MKISVKVKARAKEDRVEKLNKNHFLVFTKEQPEKGRANKKVVKLFSEYFDIPSRNIEIVSGFSTREKIIQIDL